MINEIIERAKSETPSFFKKLQAFGAICALIGTMIVSISSMVAIPETLTNISAYAIAIGTTIAATCSLPKKDAGQL
jgi:hypothetical protein